jgi:hypothetical protein
MMDNKIDPGFFRLVHIYMRHIDKVLKDVKNKKNDPYSNDDLEIAIEYAEQIKNVTRGIEWK